MQTANFYADGNVMSNLKCNLKGEDINHMQIISKVNSKWKVSSKANTISNVNVLSNFNSKGKFIT